jgi:TldD protein
MSLTRLPTRRTFLKTSATTAAALSVASSPLLAQLGRRPEAIPPIEDKRLKELALRALDAAKSEGAAYADIRLTHTRKRHFDLLNVSDDESITVGVRALVNGYWGFTSSAVWSLDEMARLGREATRLAKTAAAIGKPRVVDLSPIPVIRDGHWETPIKIDPFEIFPIEVQDYLGSLRAFSMRQRYAFQNGDAQCDAVVQDKAFAATTGTYCTQRLRRIKGFWTQGVMRKREQGAGGAVVDSLDAGGEGWEHFHDQPLEDQMLAAIDRTLKDLELPIKPVDAGRYDAVVDARVVGNILYHTIGEATQLDRAMGYEANASGTSYITDPFEMLGTFKIGAPQLTVIANRDQPGAVGTVKWDDEGVAPAPIPLVKEGILSGFSTTREGAGWLKAAGKGNAIARPSGCADVNSAFDAPRTCVPNMVMTPGKEALGFEDLVGTLKKGVAITSVIILSIDFQKLNGFMQCGAYEVKDGQRVARIGGAGTLFRAPELWKNIITLGGAQSAKRFNGPKDRSLNDGAVTAVPAVFKDMSIIDAFRKA